MSFYCHLLSLLHIYLHALYLNFHILTTFLEECAFFRNTVSSFECSGIPVSSTAVTSDVIKYLIKKKI
jgi:hypothetical protein